MKGEHKIIIIAVMVALSYWIIDAFVDYAVHSDVEFLTALLVNPTEHASRLVAFLIIVASGFCIARALSLQKHSAKEIGISETHYRRLLDTARDGIVVLSAETGQIGDVNQPLIDMLGYSREELLGNRPWETSPFKDTEACRDALSAFKDKKYILNEDLPMQTKDGRVINVKLASTVYTVNGEKVIQCTIHDLTDRTKAKEPPLVRDDFTRGVLDSMNSHIGIIDRQGRIIEINEAWKRFARENGPVDMDKVGIGVNYLEVCRNAKDSYADTARKVAEGIRNVLEGEVPIFSLEYPCPSKTEERWFLLHVTPLRGNRSGAVVAHTNITELKEMEEELHTLSITDSLTGLYNRRGFFTLAEKQIKIARRMNRTLLLFSIDLDGLKEINDTFGHQEGDLALVAAANILNATFRESDIIARIGGDEFAIIQTGASEDSIGIITARLKENLEHHNAIGKRRYGLSMSMGTSWFYPENPRSIDELLARADLMMYEQKRRKVK